MYTLRKSISSKQDEILLSPKFTIVLITIILRSRQSHLREEWRDYVRQYGTKYYSTERKYHGLLNVTAQILFQDKFDSA